MVGKLRLKRVTHGAIEFGYLVVKAIRVNNSIFQYGGSAQ